MIKWFSNFREFFYIQMERFARQAVRDALTRWAPNRKILNRFRITRFMLNVTYLYEAGKARPVWAERVSCEWVVTRSFTAYWTCTTTRATFTRWDVPEHQVINLSFRFFYICTWNLEPYKQCWISSIKL